MFLQPFLQNVKRLHSNPICKRKCMKTMAQVNKYSSYAASKPEGPPDQYTKCDITKNPEEWKYVERLMAKMVIPEPKAKENYPSGWKPVTANPKELPYFVERSKNHLIPVYLELSHRGQKKVTKVRRITGDIWLLKEQLVQHLQNVNETPIGVQVDELGGMIKFRGDYVYDIRDWLLKLGF